VLVSVCDGIVFLPHFAGAIAVLLMGIVISMTLGRLVVKIVAMLRLDDAQRAEPGQRLTEGKTADSQLSLKQPFTRQLFSGLENSALYPFLDIVDNGIRRRNLRQS